MKVLLILVVVEVGHLLCEGGSEMEGSTHEVCLSKSDHVTLTFAFPETCENENLVILDHAGRELLMWTAPCTTRVQALYKDRVKLTCEESTCRLQVTLLSLTEADNGTFQCRSGALQGPVLPGCRIHLHVIGLEDLSQVCSYWSSNRSVVCERVTQEVKIYRIGERSDRDVHYFTKAFDYTLRSREYGYFAVTRTKKSREDALCSQDFRFQVEEQTEDNDEETYTERYAISISSILIVFSVVFLFGCDVIVDLCRSLFIERMRGQR